MNRPRKIAQSLSYTESKFKRFSDFLTLIKKREKFDKF